MLSITHYMHKTWLVQHDRNVHLYIVTWVVTWKRVKRNISNVMSVELVNLDKTKIMAMKWKYNHSGWRNFTEWDEGLKTIMEQETSIICQPLNMQRVATDATRRNYVQTQNFLRCIADPQRHIPHILKNHIFQSKYNHRHFHRKSKIFMVTISGRFPWLWASCARFCSSRHLGDGLFRFTIHGWKKRH